MVKITQVFEVLKQHGITFLFKRALARLFGEQISNYEVIEELFSGKSGLEVGGPSGVFRDGGYIPLYKIVKELDGCNFSNTTIWEGSIENGEKYDFYKDKKGVQYICEAADLNQIPGFKYEFVISSNCLEHVANPLKAIKEWLRVMKKDGLLLLVLPNKDYCFDHNRPITKFSHMLDDYENNTGEDDLTHLDEILKLHDLKMDKPAGSFEEFKERSLKNFENRALHHHVFNIEVLKEIFEYFKMDVLHTDEGREHIILGRKKIE
ncbi:methyltransferase domain-containing protein [Saccharicrinis sp. FJH2]|uniref:class I SAM-dependent methyltransferase n=1 Tax=Saccharicrinis sp. FJH65 TaxID=3344659 RepID=UPI0035F4AADF